MGGFSRVLALSLAIAFLAVPVSAVPFTSSAHIRLGDIAGAFPAGLLGTAQEPRSAATVAALATANVPHVRVDAYLEDVFPTRTTTDWTAFDARLQAVVDAGAEPVLILAYSPIWMSQCPGSLGPFGGTHCPPTDFVRWRPMIAQVAERAATMFGVTHFEVWNEPDNPAFFAGTVREYANLYAYTAWGVQDAAAATGLALKIGGPATIVPNPVFIPAFLGQAKYRSLPVDFVSFHWYADYPFHGPIDPLPGTFVTDNPALAARSFGDYARLVRGWADAAGYPDAEIWVTEWNVNAGNAPRMRTAFGASFVVAALAEMDRADVSRSNYFNTQHDVHGLFANDDEARPAWQSLTALLGAGSTRVSFDRTGTPYVQALAGADANGTVRVVVTNFNAQGNIPAIVEVSHPEWTGIPATARDLDGVVVASGPLPLELVMANLDVAVVTIQP